MAQFFFAKCLQVSILYLTLHRNRAEKHIADMMLEAQTKQWCGSSAG